MPICFDKYFVPLLKHLIFQAFEMAETVSFQAKQLILKMKRFKSNSELARSLLGDLRLPHMYKEELEELSMCQAMLDLLKDVLHMLHTNVNGSRLIV